MIYSETAKCLSNLCQINLFFLDGLGKLVEYEGNCRDVTFLPDGKTFEIMKKKCMETWGAGIYSCDSYFLFGMVKIDEDTYMLCGPCCAEKDYKKRNFRFREQFGVKAEDAGITEMDTAMLAEFLTVAGAALNGSRFNPNRILTGSAVGKEEVQEDMDEAVEIYRTEQSEQGSFRYGEWHEESYYQMIRDGNVEKLDSAMKKSMPGQVEYIGDFAESEMKKAEYMFVTSLTIARRAAVDGGVKYELAADISDVYLKRLEKCRNTQEIYRLYMEMRNYHVELVHRQKEKNKKNVYVEFCMDEICRNITKPFRREELAEQISLSPGYLSALFKKETGISLTEYWTKARLSAAKNMLRYSDIPITTIAERFCFSSAGRFSRAFQKEYGITPNRYRHEQKVF